MLECDNVNMTGAISCVFCWEFTLHQCFFAPLQKDIFKGM